MPSRKKDQIAAVKEGNSGGQQVDIVIRNGEYILLDITSRMHDQRH